MDSGDYFAANGTTPRARSVRASSPLLMRREEFEMRNRKFVQIVIWVTVAGMGVALLGSAVFLISGS